LGIVPPVRRGVRPDRSSSSSLSSSQVIRYRGQLLGCREGSRTTRAALDALDDERLTAVLDDAALVAALNCIRVGADPPPRVELDEARGRREVSPGLRLVGVPVPPAQ